MSPSVHHPLVDLKAPTGHNAKYCLEEPITIDIDKRCSFSAGDYVFRDEQENIIVKSIGKANLKQETTLLDGSDNEILKLAVRMGTTRWEIYGTSPAGQEVFSIGLRMRLLKNENITTNFFDIASEQNQVLEYETWKCKGGRRLTLNGDCVACTYKDKWYKKERRVEIAANMDHTLVIATIIFYDIVMDQWLPGVIG